MREKSLDGLRGWAALFVAIGHVFYFWGRGNLGYTPPFMDGALAVYVFFALSGYVLSAPFFRSGERRLVVDQALRRYPRLGIPVFINTLLVLLLMVTGAMHNQEAGVATSSAWLRGFYAFPPDTVAALRFGLWDAFFNYDAVNSYNVNLWTMQWEMAGSLIVFALLLAVGRHTYLRAIVHGVFIGLTAWKGSPLLAFALGMLLANLTANPMFSRLASSPRAQAFSLILLMVTLVCSTLRYPGNSIQWLSIWSIILMICVLMNRWMRGLLEAPLSQWLGRISFPLYLMHLLVFCSIASWAVTIIGGSERPTPVAIVLISIGMLGISLLTATALLPIERLSVQTGRRFSSAVFSAARPLSRA
jgi:peptidoglycan/LPS O-acetylase OafA/YrhL